MGAIETSRGIAATPAALEHDLGAAGYVLERPERSATTVLDTFDGRLAAAGLRLDHAGTALVLHDGSGRDARTVVDAAPRLVDDLDRGPFRSRLADVVEVRALLPLATVAMSTRRAERRNDDGKVTSVVTIHEELSADDRALPGWLVTVAELTGYGKPGERARDVVAGHVADPAERDALDAVLAMAGIERTGTIVEPGIPLAPDLPAAEGFRLVLANLDEAIEVNLPGTVDDLDSEFLHDLRVAVRRTRSILRHGRHVIAPDVLAWAEPGFKRIGDVTSPPRDLDVQVLEWDGAVAGLDDADRRALEPLHRQLRRDRVAAHDELAGHLRAGDVAELLHRWREVVGTPADPERAGVDGAAPLADVVRRRIRSAQQRLLEHGRAITPDTPADDVHEIRKDAKKLRYLLECFADLLPGDDRKAFVKRLKKLQDLLGEHQDAEVHAVELRHAAELLPDTTGPATYVAVGRLVEHLERTRQAARDAFAERFAEYDAPATRRVLRDVLDGVGR
jgi:CHAD domain-containing protein